MGTKKDTSFERTVFKSMIIKQSVIVKYFFLHDNSPNPIPTNVKIDK